jgi:hypothetical protein
VNKVCSAVLAVLFDHDSGGVFSAPVSKDVPGYARLIPNPMDLGTMASKHYPTVGRREVPLACVLVA